MTRMISTGRAARILNVCQRTVQRWAKARYEGKTLAPITVEKSPTGRYTISLEDVVALDIEADHDRLCGRDQ